MWIIESSLGLPSKEYYLDPEKKEVRDAYVSFISKLWSLADFSNPSLSAQNILALETQIAYHSELVSAKRNRKDYKTVPNLRTFNELPSNWSWHDYFESLGEDWLNCGDIDVLSVSNPPHLEFVTNLMGPHLQELELLRHYTKCTDFSEKTLIIKRDPIFITLKGRILLTYSPFLSREFVNAHFNFFGKVLEGRQQPVDRWVWMLEFLNEQAGQLLGELYCDHYFSASSKNQVTEIANTIVEELKATVSNLDWMESNTKAHAIEKLRNLRLKIGYPDKFMNYSTFIPILEDTFVDIIRQLAVFNTKQNLLLGNKPTDFTRWLIPPQAVYTFYHPLRNELVLPAGMLQSPLFGPTKDLCVNYGAIGATIGRECIHIFDEQGKDVNAHGKINNWWSFADFTWYKQRLPPIIAQYSNLRVIADFFVNGELTLQENIADIGGLTVAYRAMEMALQSRSRTQKELDNFTPEQRFFISWCQLHREKYQAVDLTQRLKECAYSPSKFRASQPLRNIKAFYDAFYVDEVEDAMFLDEKQRATLW